MARKNKNGRPRGIKRSCEKIQGIIHRIWLDQMECVTAAQGVKFEPKTTYKDVTFEFVYGTLCPLIKNINDPEITRTVLKTTRRAIKRSKGSVNDLSKVIAYLS